jgi:4-hydroxyisophthalate hydroxylase
MTEQYDVVIIGAGPVGLGLAVELGQRGVRCLLVERSVEEHRIPKGQNLTNRTLEHFRAWHCANELRAARTMPQGYPIGGVTAYRSLIGKYWLAGSGGGGRGEQVARLFSEAAERLPQYRTEYVLRARVAQLPSVTLRRGWTLDTVEDHGDHVAAGISSDGISEIVRGRYLVGSDGSRSTVRTLVGIDSTHAHLGSRMVLCVFKSAEFETIVARFPPGTTLRVLTPELQGNWQFFGRVAPDATWFFHAPVPDGPVDDETIRQLLFKAVGRAFEVDVQHAGFWDLRISIANDYRRGNIFIAGDACHSHPPYGGFGLNSGLEDSRNLGWKLAAALQGWGGEALLDSYTPERRPIFERTADIIESYIEGDRNFMERFDPEIDKEAFESAWPEEMRRVLAAAYFPHYEGSPSVPGVTDRKPGVDGLTTPEARSGHHLAPARLSDGRTVADATGDGFMLLAFDAPDAATVFATAARSIGLPLGVIEDSFAGERAEYLRRIILVRPDGYIGWAGDAAPADVAAMLRQVSGLAG